MDVLVSLLVVLSAVLAGGVLVVVFFLTRRSRGEYYVSDAVRLWYTDEGQGQPVILLHGFAVNGDLNCRRSGITASLRKDFRVITLDLRGHGLSDKPHESHAYGYAMVTDVLGLMDHLGIRRAHLAGYSLGGFIGLKLAATHPQRLLSLALLGAGWVDPANRFFHVTVPRFAAALRAGQGIDPLMEGLGPGRPPPGLLHRGLVRLMTGYFNDGKALAALVEGLAELTVDEQELASIRLPVLGIVGSADPLKREAEALAGRLPDYRLVIIEGAGHILAATSRQLRETLRQFLLR